jgi:hypothetical protein
MAYEIRYASPEPVRHAGSFILVVSHMRSFSSLLCHILGSHPEISGYGETQQPYRGRIDLDRLARTVRGQIGDAPLGRFVLDKILHNHLEIAPTVLARPDVRCLFLLREPRDTMSSVIDMVRSLGRGQGALSDPQQVAAYYAERVRQMAHYATLPGLNAVFVDSARLIDDTDAVLAGLSRWLDLGSALVPEYQTFPLTGRPGHGDTSANIRAGTIVKDAELRHRDREVVAIPDDALERASRAYDACRAALSERCPSM